MKKNLKLTMLSIILLLVCAILFSSIYAYFTDGDTTTNTFTIGKIKIELQEPNWTPPTNITPNQEIEKDPQVANTGRNEAYIYLTVQIPIKNLITAEPDGTKKDKDYVELFTYDINPGWEQVGSDIIQETDVIKIYAYSTDSNCTSLKPGETTPSLFDKVVFANAIEDQGLELTSQEIIINAYCIQTNNVNGNKTDASSIWEVIKNQRQLKYDEVQHPTENQAILMKGEEFNTLFLENFPEARKVEFTKNRTLPMDTTPIDFSEKQNKAILGWQEDNTVYINADTDISANSDSSMMFCACDKLNEISFKNIDTSNVTNMEAMFVECNALIQLDLSNFDTSNVINISGIFAGCHSLTQLDVSNINTSNVTNMSGMFSECHSLTQLNLNNFDTCNVTNMSSMFSGCIDLTQLGISNINTSNVTDMSNMFNVCSLLSSLDLSNFNTSKVTNMESMFSGCENLTTLDISNFNTSNVTDMYNMFNVCSSLTQLDLSNFDTSKVTNMANMFSGCQSLTSLNLNNFNTSNVIDMNNMFIGCNVLTLLEISKFNTSNVTDMSGMFRDCNSLILLDISNFNTSNVTNMRNLFSSCTDLQQLDISKFDISNVTDMSYIFSECNSLTTVYVRSQAELDAFKGKLSSTTNVIIR